ncbi:helix-turn-helix domain-containing protein [Ostreibacterium oceani]|uniref:Helix-turn-helix domain-containing protein n=1 Tax=Ostreibacterium oceani TaxID=2654998 RepID=A0A6N7EVV5_9GAMM|nr:helix-turn-helix transcriptional regulator [Ostreibacterium oceani]MPV86894.1 helix-turn-helix domain-containing protein [Ostreibacterium oceani]
MQEKNAEFCEILKAERIRLGLGQLKFSELSGVSVNSQSNYETGKAIPNAEYLSRLADIGVDVLFLLTGKRNDLHLSNEEALLLSLFRDAPVGVQRHILAGLLQGGVQSGETSPAKTQGSTSTVGNNSPNSGNYSGNAASGDININAERPRVSKSNKSSKSVKQTVTGDGNVTIGGNVKNK